MDTREFGSYGTLLAFTKGVTYRSLKVLAGPGSAICGLNRKPVGFDLVSPRAKYSKLPIYFLKVMIKYS